MKNLPWKKIAIGAVAIGIVTLGIFYFTSSKGTKPAVTFVNPAFGEYITSYTAGVLSSGSTLRIILAKDVVDSASVGKETSVKLFSLSPSAKGKTIWLDRHTIEYTPETRLSSGQVYALSFYLSKLI